MIEENCNIHFYFATFAITSSRAFAANLEARACMVCNNLWIK